MYPAYPFLALNAALALHVVAYHLGHIRPRSLLTRIPGIIKAGMMATAVLLCLTLGVSRTLGTVTAYQAPLQIYKPLSTPQYAEMNASVCLGKEWYRFPSSYHLPSKMRAHFLKSEFKGLLPGQFAEQLGSIGLPRAWAIPSGMNDQNLEDVGKYVGNL